MINITKCRFGDDIVTGDITKEYTVWCGNCSIWLQLPCNSQKDMIKEIKLNGWFKHKNLGWICPDCKRELIKNENGGKIRCYES